MELTWNWHSETDDDYGDGDDEYDWRDQHFGSVDWHEFVAVLKTWLQIEEVELLAVVVADIPTFEAFPTNWNGDVGDDDDDVDYENDDGDNCIAACSDDGYYNDGVGCGTF